MPPGILLRNPSLGVAHGNPVGFLRFFFIRNGSQVSLSGIPSKISSGIVSRDTIRILSRISNGILHRESFIDFSQDFSRDSFRDPFIDFFRGTVEVSSGFFKIFGFV